MDTNRQQAAGKVMAAKFAGTCKACGGVVKVGDAIVWSKAGGAVHFSAEACIAAKASRAAGAALSAPVVTTASAGPIAAFIGAAKARGLKFPKARFLAPDGRSEMRLSVAGARSKAPGAINVLIADEWIGRITVDGAVQGSLQARADVLATLDAIAVDPAAAAKAYGALMCRCSFCNLSLTDAGSVEVGYGPVCAKHWGLPHAPKGTPELTAIEAGELQSGLDDYGFEALPALLADVAERAALPRMSGGLI